MKPVWITPQTKILILGSYPWVKTLDKNNQSNDIITRRRNFLESQKEKKEPEYYSDNRNMFWSMLLWEDKKWIDYEEKIKFLQKNNIWLWDVFKYADREGSSDNAINLQKSEFNALYSFFLLFPHLKEIIFNWDTAFEYFKKYINATNTKNLLEKEGEKLFLNLPIWNWLVRKVKINTIYSTSWMSRVKVPREKRIARLEKTWLKKFIKNI